MMLMDVETSFKAEAALETDAAVGTVFIDAAASASNEGAATAGAS